MTASGLASLLPPSFGRKRPGVVWCGVVAAVRAEPEYHAAGRKQSYLAGAQAVDVDVDVDEGATYSRVSPRSIRVELLSFNDNG